MKKTVLLVMAILLAVAAGPIAQAQSSACEVKIFSPTGEETVSAEGDVVGSARIPKGSYIWLFARRDDSPRQALWPQQGIAAEDLTQSPTVNFSASVHYGERVDIGKNFRVILVVVDPLMNRQLEKWLAEAPDNNYKPWFGLPRSVEGCTPTDVVVKKVAH